MSNYLVHRCRLFEYNPCAIQCMAATSNSTDLAVARSDGSIEIWNTTDSWFQKMVIPGSSDRSVEAMIWVGNRLISGGLHGEVTEYDLTSCTIKTSVDSYGGAVWCLHQSPTQEQIAAGCEDGSIKIFETRNKSIKYERAFDRQEGRILTMSWHESGDVIVTGSVDIIRIWSTKTGHAIQRITIEREMRKIETIIWSVIILRDYTIISGDSSGRVQFWNGKNATLLKSHHIHRADVLCLCLSKNGKSVFAGGVDPKVFEFNLLSTSDPTSWVKGRGLQKHTHDIRALTLVGNTLVSGGVDTNLITRGLIHKGGYFKKVTAFPSKSKVSVSSSAMLLVLQYPQYLDVWKLAKSISPSDMRAGTSVPIEEQPIKLLQIKPPSSSTEQISCSCISSCGTWVAYSTQSTFRLYRLHENDDLISVNINRVHCVGLAPAHTVVFTPDCSHMIASTTNHKILIAKLEAETSEARLLQILPLKSHTTVTHLLAVSSGSKFLATADLKSEINVYDITSMTHHCSLPRYTQTPTAISFHPITSDVVVAYDNMQVMEYNISNMEYTKWTKECLVQNSKPLLVILREQVRRSDNIDVVTDIKYHSKDGKDVMFLRSSEGIYVIERTSNRSRSTKSQWNSRFSNQFMPLLHSEMIDENTLLVVERPLQDIFDQLPPTLYQKKFGT